MAELVHVAVGVLIDSDGKILIAKRPDKLHQGGLWEFPGGKVEADEAVADALKREFKEEVNLKLNTVKPLLEITHDYGDKQVLLDVWQCQDYMGQAEGLEGQPIQWVTVADLDQYAFPKANQAIITHLKSHY